MKLFTSLLITFLMGSVLSVSAQQFTLPSGNETDVFERETKSTIAAKLPIKNTQNEIISMKWAIVSNTFPSVKNWQISLCDPCQCYINPHPNSGTCKFLENEQKLFIIDLLPKKTPGTGTMVVKFWSENEEESTAQTFKMTITAGPNSVDNLISTEMIQISPNPASNLLQINRTTSDVDLFSASIFDLAGNTLLSTQLNGANNTIDISNLSNGFYFINIIDTKGNTITQKFIKN